MDVLAELVGASPSILAVKERMLRLLQRQSDRSRLPPVLIQGETGTGKGLVARGLHRASPRADGPFVDVNCAAIPETLLEAEMFGYERGAFTDARQGKAGLFQTAHRGTIFLDELGLLPLGLQAKLLKVIEERAVRRLGSTRSEPTDVWVLAATSEDLVAATRGGRFREDLYHRLAVVTLALPPLRERAGDVLLLAEHFLARACADYDVRPKVLTADARAALLAYPWPGNIRELANVMERVALLWEASAVTAEALALGTPTGVPSPETAPVPADEAPSLEDALGAVEREHLLQALRETGGNVTRAAARLGISRDTLRYRITKHGLGREGAAVPPAARRAPRPAAPPAATARGRTDAPPAAVRWDRRRLALLQVALVLPPPSDPRLYPSRVIEVIAEKVRSFGGRVEELGPTGMVAAFGVEPVEDAPRCAAHAAMAIQKAAERARREDTAALPVRLAIHVGPFLVGQARGEAQLDLESKRQAWGLLEALMAEAEPDAIVVSEAAVPFLERHVPLVPTGPSASPRGATYRLAPGERPDWGLGRRMATFVGRGQELELLQSRLERAMRGHGQAVGILGEAGIGKSRLLFEFRRALQDLRVTYLEGRCHSYGSAIPYLPVLDILRQNFRVTELDGPDEITEKVRAGLTEVGMAPDEWAPYLLQILGVKEGTERLADLTPGAIKVRTFEALRQMCLSGSRRRPIVFVIEDLHWIDATSEECFASLMESMAAAPAMILATYRPGYRPPWVDRAYATQVALPPLTPEASLTVVRSVLQQDDVPDRLARVIVQRAEGNPFFIEELARAVRTPDELRPPVAVPETIQEVVLARVDRLAEAPKRLLETASVIGREVPVPLLRAIWEGPGDLERPLRELTRLDFLFPSSGGTEPVYAFLHTLTQEVTYESLPAARRQALHGAVGRALEAAYAGRLDEVYARLGYHYSRAGEAGKAIDYLTRLAERAVGSHAHLETISIVEEALGHVDRLPEAEGDRRRLTLVLHQAYSLILLGRLQEVVDLLERHRAALDRLADPAIAGHYYFLLSRSHLFLGDDARATESAERGLAEATRSGDDATLGKIHYLLAQQAALSGRSREGLEHGRQAVRLLTRTGEQGWLGTAYWALGLNHGLRSEFGPALEAQARATAIGEAVGDPHVLGSAAWATGAVLAATGSWDAAIVHCTRALEYSPDPLNAATAAGWLGYTHLERGDLAAAIPHLDDAVRRLGQFRFPQLEGLFTALLAEAYRRTGRGGEALELARRAADTTRRAGSLYGVAWAERVLGRLARDRGDGPEAEARFAEALRTFEAIGSVADAGVTHGDLALLAQAHGRPEAARTHRARVDELFAMIGIPGAAARALAVEAVPPPP